MPIRPEDNPKPWIKGQSGNPNGRPRKIVNVLGKFGYKKGEINETISTMMTLTMEELKDIYQDKNSTILEKTIASALKKGIEKGDLGGIETLLNRVYGRAKLEVDVNMDSPIQIILPKKEDEV